MRSVVIILAACLLVAEARGRYGYKKYSWHDRGPGFANGGNRNGDRYQDRTNQGGHISQRAGPEERNNQERLEDPRRGPPADVATNTEERSRWGEMGGSYHTNRQRTWQDKMRKYGLSRELPRAENERTDQQQQNDTRQGSEENDRHRQGETGHHGHYRPGHDSSHHRGPNHHRGHKKHYDHRHHEHDRHHHDHDRHHRHHEGHDSRRHHGPPHGHHDHHRGHKGGWSSSSSEEDWSRNSNESSSGSGSWHKGKHYGRHHKKYGSSSSSEESRSRSWSRESGSHEDHRKGKKGKKYEKPSYNVTCMSSSGYEVRRYDEAVWVTTLVSNSSYEMAGRTGFKRLLKYIKGHNDGNVKINMTKPVRKMLEPESEETTNLTRCAMRSVSFFLPRQFWDNPPEPLDENVFLERKNASDVFVYTFSRYAPEHKVKEKYRRLRNVLEMEEQPISEGYFAVQEYDPPWTYYDRHNEVLISADSSQGTPSCPEGIRQFGDLNYDHHRGHKGGWSSSSSEEDKSWNSHKGSSGSGSWHKGKHYGRHHKKYGSSSSSEESRSRSWSRESGSHEDHRKGKTCKKYEKPSYNVTCMSSLGYEVRRYDEAVWVTTLVSNSSYEMAGRTGFKRLLKYIKGHNNGGIKINMTKPVRKMLEPESEETTNLTRSAMRSVSFFLPRQFWDNPPEPLDENVFLERESVSDVFVYTFSRYAPEHKVKEKYRRLRHILEMSEQPILEGYFAVQEYDPPWVYYDRHNEVLIRADSSQGTPSCPEEFSDGTRQFEDLNYGHHRGHRGGWSSSSSEEDRSWNSHEGSSGSGSWHKGKHYGRHHKKYGSSSSSEESRSRSWSRESGSHEDHRKGKKGKKYEKPSYNVTCMSSSGYEVRRYDEAVWVTTLVSNSSYEMAGRTGFKRLLKYIKGHNSGGIKINMTKPVRKTIEPESEETTNLTRSAMRSVSFFLPLQFWDNPPEPLDENVFLERESASDVFVYTFSRSAPEHKVEEKYRRLRNILELNEQPISEGYFAVQEYDPPWIYNRHNEILIRADPSLGTPACPEEFPNGIRQCGDRECPTYTKLETLSEQIFVRQVEAGVYATKKSTTCDMSSVMRETYMPLHEYFEGANDGAISMPRTVPVLQLGVRPDRTNSMCNFTYQTMFFIPEAYQESPPIPNDETITVSAVGQTKYYVINFVEAPTPRTAFEKYNELTNLLKERELCYFGGIFQLAFYDAPWRPRPHLYELSIPADETCISEAVEDFEAELFPQNENGQIRLPSINDEPNPVPYVLG